MALTTFMRSWADFEYVTAITLPLFLFSATFYPLSSYGGVGLGRAAQPAVPRRRASCAALNLGDVGSGRSSSTSPCCVALSVAGLVVAVPRASAACS